MRTFGEDSSMAELKHFVLTQAPVYAGVLDELGRGRKTSHWMWFIFPQLAGLGRSATAKYYGLIDLAAAKSFLAHPVLGPRLVACTRLVNAIEGRSAQAILGTPDDLKFRSSMTLFGRADPGEPAFGAALAKYYGGIEDPATLALLGL